VEAVGTDPTEVTMHVGFKLPHNLVYPHEKGEKREEELVRKERKNNNNNNKMNKLLSLNSL